MIKNYSITVDQIVCQGEGNIVSDMDGEKVILSIQNGKYYNLGEVGGDLWARISESKSVKELIDDLYTQYEVEKSVCEEHVLSFLSLLVEEDLIQIVG